MKKSAAAAAGNDEDADLRAVAVRLCRHLAARDLIETLQSQVAAQRTRPLEEIHEDNDLDHRGTTGGDVGLTAAASAAPSTATHGARRRRSAEAVHCVDVLGRDANTDHSQFDEMLPQFSTETIMEALEIACSRLEIVPASMRRQLVERYELIAGVAASSNSEVYAKLLPVLWHMPETQRPVFGALCAMLRSCRDAGRELAAEWAGRFLILDMYQSEAVVSFRSVRVARDLMRVIIDRHEIEAEEGALLSSPRASAAPFPYPADSTESSGKGSRKDKSNDSSKKKSGSGWFASLRGKLGRGRGSSNPNSASASAGAASTSAAASASASAFPRNTSLHAPPEIFPQTHRLSAADHAALLTKTAQTPTALAERYGRAPPPPPPQASPSTAPKLTTTRRRHSSLDPRHSSETATYAQGAKDQQQNLSDNQENREVRMTKTSGRKGVSGDDSERRRSLSHSDVDKIQDQVRDLSSSELSIL